MTEVMEEGNLVEEKISPPLSLYPHDSSLASSSSPTSSFSSASSYLSSTSLSSSATPPSSLQVSTVKTEQMIPSSSSSWISPAITQLKNEVSYTTTKSASFEESDLSRRCPTNQWKSSLRRSSSSNTLNISISSDTLSDDGTSTEGSNNSSSLNMRDSKPLLEKYRIVIMGAAAVGKTALTQQFTQHIFNKAYDPTIETQSRKLVDIDGVNSAIEIIDTGGQLEYLCLRDQYIAGGEGFLLVYNIRRKQSFTTLALMRKKILEIKGVAEFPMVVVGAQSDSPANRRQVSREELEAIGKEWRVPVFETSAKDRVNVEEPYKALIRMIRAEDEIKNAGKARLKDFINPHEWWLDQTKRHEITILVFYRGLWCPFCKNYMKGWNKLVREIWDKGAVIYGVTSQSQAMADKAEKKWRLNYDVISDQENVLAKTHGIHITNTVIMDYPKGMVQPGVFIITNKQQILYKWAVSPNITNLEGAIDRPDPKDVWQNIKNLQEGNLNRVKIHHSTRRWMWNN